jgi:hypothetical protein
MLSLYNEKVIEPFFIHNMYNVLALIYEAKLKGAHEHFKSLMGKNLDPDCKP